MKLTIPVQPKYEKIDKVFKGTPSGLLIEWDKARKFLRNRAKERIYIQLLLEVLNKNNKMAKKLDK